MCIDPPIKVAYLKRLPKTARSLLKGLPIPSHRLDVLNPITIITQSDLATEHVVDIIWAIRFFFNTKRNRTNIFVFLFNTNR